MLVNFAFFVMMVVFLFVTRYDTLEEQILVMLMRVGIILIVQISFNLMMYAIPRFFPRPEPKEPK